jgi:hypothetical protein
MGPESPKWKSRVKEDYVTNCRLVLTAIVAVAVMALLAGCAPKDARQAAAGMGIEVYPGASPLPMGWKVNSGRESVPGAQFRTPDSAKKVHMWYREKYPKNIIIPSEHTDWGKLPWDWDHQALSVPPEAGDTKGSILIVIDKERDGSSRITLARLH